MGSAINTLPLTEVSHNPLILLKLETAGNRLRVERANRDLGMLNLSGYFVPSGIRLHNCGWCFLDVLCSGKPLPGLPLRIPGLILLAFSLLPNTPSSSYFILILTSLHVSSSREKETRMILTMNPKYPKKVSSRNRLSLPESTFCSKPTEGLDLHAGGRAVGKDSRISGLEQERNG